MKIAEQVMTGREAIRCRPLFYLRLHFRSGPCGGLWRTVNWLS